MPHSLFGTPDEVRGLLADPARLWQTVPHTRAALLVVLALPGADLGQDEHLGLSQTEDLDFCRTALSTWQSLLPDVATTLTWLGGPDGVLAFHRGNFACTLNLADQPVPVIGPVLLASTPIVYGLLPPQAAVWTSGLPGVDQAAQYTVHEGW